MKKGFRFWSYSGGERGQTGGAGVPYSDDAGDLNFFLLVDFDGLCR